MTGKVNEPATTIWEDEQYVYIPEEWFKYLPPDMQSDLHARKQEGQAVLQVVDKDIGNLIRLANAFPTMVSLRHIHHRLATTPFEPTVDAVLDHDMLTSSFAVTYARLADGGVGSGVARDQLPVHLRPVHDHLIELRNKRFAHNAGHRSLTGGLEIRFEGGRFDVNLNFNMGFHVGGANEWEELVTFLDRLMHDRLQKLLARLSEKTGYEWSVPAGAAPPWAEMEKPQNEPHQ